MVYVGSTMVVWTGRKPESPDVHARVKPGRHPNYSSRGGKTWRDCLIQHAKISSSSFPSVRLKKNKGMCVVCVLASFANDQREEDVLSLTWSPPFP